MNTILTRLAMLAFFLLGITCGWAAFTMVFPASLFNILLGFFALYFILNGFDILDRLNKLGPYADPEEEVHNQKYPRSGDGPAFGEGEPEEKTPEEE